MTNKEWLDYLAHNAPDELAAWFDAEHVETEERALDGDTESENEDSRELLEAEIESYSAFDMMDTITLDMVIGWLDRQAAITAGETSNAWEEYRGATQREIAELIAERDNLKANNEQLHTLAGEQAVKIDELTQIAESKRVSFADRIRFVNKIDELTAEREQYRKLFGMALDWAHEITMLESSVDEGMA